jgi:transposase
VRGPEKKEGEEHSDEAIGRSKGGLSTKIHAVVDGLAKPIGFHLTQGQVHDLVGADVLLGGIQAGIIIADKAYDADERVIAPLEQGAKRVVIAPKSNRKSLRTFDRYLYKARHLIENFFCRLKQFRGIATRYDKTARHFLAAIHLTATLIWLI